MKKRISLLVIGLMLFAINGSSFAASMPFGDISTFEQKDKILSLQERGIITGVGVGVFAPSQTLSVAEGIQLIVSGFEIAGDINVNQKWTKEAFISQLVNRMEAKGNLPMLKIIPATINGQDQITPENDGALQRSLLYNLTTLDKDDNYNPKSEVTRAEAAAIIYNVIEYLNNHPAPSN